MPLQPGTMLGNRYRVESLLGQGGMGAVYRAWDDRLETWQVCDALTCLHSQTPPLIHRDIKPQNIKITPEGHAFLVNFGLSKVGSTYQSTASGALGVTAGYAPLEQYGSAHTDQRTDVYALTATLYAMLTGEPPPESVKRAVRTVTLTPPRR